MLPELLVGVNIDMCRVIDDGGTLGDGKLKSILRERLGRDKGTPMVISGDEFDWSQTVASTLIWW